MKTATISEHRSPRTVHVAPAAWHGPCPEVAARPERRLARWRRRTPEVVMALVHERVDDSIMLHPVVEANAVPGKINDF